MMHYDIVAATYVEGYTLHLTFADGKAGTVDFLKFIRKGGVFTALEDLDRFRQFSLDPELGVITWEGGVDVAPETLYAEATGEPLPAWMTPTEVLRETA